MNKNAFGCLPLTSSIAAGQSTNLHLTRDWTSEWTSRHSQELFSVCVTKLNVWISMPTVAVAQHFPVVASVTFAWLITVCRDFLIVWERTREDVRVEVFTCGHVLESNDISALNLLSTTASLSSWAFDRPVWVDIVWSFQACHRLLATSSSVLNIMRMQSASVVDVEQLDYTSTCYKSSFGGYN